MYSIFLGVKTCKFYEDLIFIYIVLLFLKFASNRFISTAFDSSRRQQVSWAVSGKTLASISVVVKILISKLPRRQITVDSNKAASPLTRGRQRFPGRGLRNIASRWLLRQRAAASCLFDDLSSHRDPLWSERYWRPPHVHRVCVTLFTQHRVVHFARSNTPSLLFPLSAWKEITFSVAAVIGRSSCVDIFDLYSYGFDILRASSLVFYSAEDSRFLCL